MSSAANIEPLKKEMEKMITYASLKIETFAIILTSLLCVIYKLLGRLMFDLNNEWGHEAVDI